MQCWVAQQIETKVLKMFKATFEVIYDWLNKKYTIISKH